MKKYECVLFDLDGTLVNSYEGILNSYIYTAEKMGLTSLHEREVNEVIGAPLHSVFKERFSLDEKQSRIAIELYRTRYAEKGIYEVQIYSQIEKLLLALQNKKKRLGVATLKKEELAYKMLDYLGIVKYFEVVKGMDEADLLTKKDIILRAIQQLGTSRENTVLIGDSEYDAIGAKEAGVDFIGVSYGFGFKSMQNTVANKIQVTIVKEPFELIKYID